MPRLMSFSLTTAQFRDRSKTVTRRAGWASLQPGDVVTGVVKAMGLRKGERVERIHDLRVVSNRPEALQALLDDPEYGAAEAAREGFPEWTGAEFVAFFCREARCTPALVVNRVEFEHLP